MNCRIIKFNRCIIDVVFGSLILFTVIYLFVGLLNMSDVYENNLIVSVVGVLATFHLLSTPIGLFGLYLDQKVMILFFIVSASIWTLLMGFYIIFFYSILREYKKKFREESLHLTLLFVYISSTIIAISIASVKLLKRKYQVKVD